MENESVSRELSKQIKAIALNTNKQVKTTQNLAKVASQQVSSANNLFKVYKSSTDSLKSFAASLTQSLKDMKTMRKGLESELKTWNENYNNANSPEEKAAALAQLNTLAGALNQLKTVIATTVGNKKTTAGVLSDTMQADKLRAAAEIQYKERIDNLNSIFGVDIEDAVEKTNKFSAAIMSTKGRIGLAATALFFLGKAGVDAFRTLHKEVGSVGAASVLTGKAISGTVRAAFSGYKLDLSDAAEIASTLATYTGSLDVPAKAIQSAGRLVSIYKLGSEEAGHLVGALTIINKHNIEAVNTTLSYVQALATANKVAPKKIFEDLAANSGELARYSAATQRNFINATVAARKLGLEISAITGVADRMLDFESSIEAEMQAAAMIGRNVDLTKARQAALANDMEGLSQALSEQLRGIDLGKLNRLQQNAIASAVGLNMDQLKKVIAGKSGDLIEATPTGDKLIDKVSTLTAGLQPLTIALWALVGVMLKQSIGGGLGKVGGMLRGLAGGGAAKAAATAGAGKVAATGGAAVATRGAGALLSNIPLVGPIAAGVTAALASKAMGAGIGKSLFSGLGSAGGSIIPGLALLGSLGGATGGALLYDKLFGGRDKAEVADNDEIASPVSTIAQVDTSRLERKLDELTTLMKQGGIAVFLDGKKVSSQLVAATARVNA